MPHLLDPEAGSRYLANHLLGLRRSVVFRSEVCREVPGRSPVGRVGHRLIARELGGMAMGIHAGHIVARVGEVCSVATPS